jgi:hypothetical protein
LRRLPRTLQGQKRLRPELARARTFDFARALRNGRRGRTVALRDCREGIAASLRPHLAARPDIPYKFDPFIHAPFYAALGEKQRAMISQRTKAGLAASGPKGYASALQITAARAKGTASMKAAA